MDKLLVPTDGSEGSLAAVRWAIAYAKAHPGTEIHVVNVQPALPSAVTSFLPAGTAHQYHREQSTAAAEKARKLLDEAGLQHHLHCAVGPAAPQIVEVARREGCSQIVMGTRGLGALPSVVLGSVASRVAALSPLPVTLVR
jgi:nucleotide-binding universal stress UspA family protein